MKTLEIKIEEVIAKENDKNSKIEKFKEINTIIENLDKLGISNKPTYDLPPVDTIGKNLYSDNKKYILSRNS